MTLHRLIGSIILGTVLAAAGAAPAQTTSADLSGKAVKGADGVLLGVVARVIAGPSGRPAQVLVQPSGRLSGGPRSLSAAGLTVAPDQLTTPLTKAEFEAMPVVVVEPGRD